MTIEELKQHNGQNGNRAYVAVNGKIYDLSSSSHWQEGNHEGVHQAGRDLSEELKSAPHVRSVIERFPVVGEITIETKPTTLNMLFIIVEILAALAIAGYFYINN